MAYNPFLDNSPIAATNGSTIIDETRQNLDALRDAVVMGSMPGWTYANNGVDKAEPDQIEYSKGVERIRGLLTWGTSGGAAGNLTQAVWDYSADSGGLYENIGNLTIAYDPSGNVTGASWV